MKPKTRKYLKYGVIGVALVVSSPFLVFGGLIAYFSVLAAFPSDEDAKILFRRVTGHSIPENAHDLYFRTALGSPTDDGGSVITFKADVGAINTLLNTDVKWPANVVQWKSLADAFDCRCSDCLRDSRQITVPSGAQFKLRGRIRTKSLAEHTLLAVDENSGTVFMCRFDP